MGQPAPPPATARPSRPVLGPALAALLVLLLAGCGLPLDRGGRDAPAALPPDARILASGDMDGDGRPEVAASFQRLFAQRLFPEEQDADTGLRQWAADGERVRGIYTADGRGGWRPLWEQADPAWQPAVLPRVTEPRALADWAPLMTLQFADLGGHGRQEAVITRAWRRVIPHLSLVVLAFDGRATHALLELKDLPYGTLRLEGRRLLVEESQIAPTGCQCTPTRWLRTTYRLLGDEPRVERYALIAPPTASGRAAVGGRAD